MSSTWSSAPSSPSPCSSSSAAPPAYAFVTWDAALGRRLSFLAIFGSRAEQTLTARLVCVDPPRADLETLANADDVRGAIALVVRGGCSFIDKARRVQAAGAVAMLLANNTREEQFTMFTMADESSPESQRDVTIPCVMMCLHDVRELFKQYPPSVKTGVLTLEVPSTLKAEALYVECEQRRQQLMKQEASGWLTRKTSSLIKRWEAPPVPQVAVETSSITHMSSVTIATESSSPEAPPPAARVPLFAFVQWATSAHDSVLFFAPLADFSVAVEPNAVFEAPCIACDPLLAHQDPIVNAADIRGAIALVQRGACTFPAKLERVQRCDAIAMIVGNDDAEDPDAAFVMSVDQINVDKVAIPAVMVSRNVFTRLQTEKPSRVRVLCLAGEIAAEWLGRQGESIALTEPPSNEQDDNALARFHRACREADIVSCQLLIEGHGASALVHTVDASLRSALHHVCGSEVSDDKADALVALLLLHHARVDKADVLLQTPLHLACLRGHRAVVQRLLGANSSASTQLTTAQNLGGRTPLHYTSEYGHTACLELLLSVNARFDMSKDGSSTDKFSFLGVDTTDVEGLTPLHVACDALQLECVLYLLAANADIDALDHKERTPLIIACERVNDEEDEARKDLALRIVEKLLEAGASCLEPNDAFVLDRIRPVPLRRELELVYLRREAVHARKQLQDLSKHVSQQNERLSALRTLVERLEATVEIQEKKLQKRDERLNRQQRQLEQLQRQLQTVLQVLQGTGSVSGYIPVTPNPQDEQERAQEAALARDVGKKCCRQHAYALAEAHFERSIELFPLPGVARLLEETRELRAKETVTKQPPVLLPVGNEDDSDATTKRRELTQLRDAVQQTHTSEATKDTLLAEINKLEGFSRSSNEYQAATKWLEWLVALPWDADATLSQRLHLERAMFDELEQLEQEAWNQRLHLASKTIQRAFRKRFAEHLMRRVLASTQIQAWYRGVAQRICHETQQSEEPVAESTITAPLEAGACHSRDDDGDLVDLEKMLDPWAMQRIQSEAAIELVTGEYAEDSSTFLVVQLVRQCSNPTVFFVWKRWGASRALARQCQVSGPYDTFETASRRYKRLVESISSPATNKMVDQDDMDTMARSTVARAS
ncbi:hypothetical protein Poli38472_012165 [Pythium oligandrum]|uniref:PA domain-containing protein n=1 Tax=Pythium oligandrum TaxID=41045 RepID=A0A8K1FN83_PYTOL|nr:hypothetical protein Poli38472_012165 [Pythium oligandrum]|eukprot:TMW67049.1 hypothetical protein Poli38472_012165 [Pythium oligandrum]